MTWLTTAEVAARTGRHTVTVRRAAADGSLHSHQPLRGGRPVPGSRRRFAAAAVDAWVQGLDDRTQRQACGCAALRAVRRAG